MNVQLLGCLELHNAAGERVSASPTVGLLLAALAWSPNTFTADGDIIDRLWEDRPPTYPRNALYTLATRLRKAIRSLDASGVECDVIRRQGGYVLVIDEEAVDTCRFRALVRQARGASDRGEGELALRLYEDALSLWRGDPLSDIRTQWAEGVRVTLGHEWRNAVLSCAEAALHLNRHDDYVPQLHQLAALHPLDERVAGLLMLALYRSGRQDEALRSFHRIRSGLVDGLGDEPGHELRALHERILRRDERIRITHPILDILAS
ncbi:BTAD domain-containing putative transcriptional regulator [Streptomyces sp. NPDC101151]|uniref:AfsR/SARP family transcriptional regulator n=1 Tax=Streptomyces sp. NPDC101151 TaxID=3366115 RepID=UPI00382EA489